MKASCFARMVLIAGCLLAGDRRTPAEGTSDYVFLLHGLGRTPRSMHKMAEALRTAGYEVVNPGYPSREQTVPRLAEWLRGAIRENCPDRNRRIHFVTHSMGGIVVRRYLAGAHDARVGRVVMLAPPNQGSELVDTFGDLSLFAWLYGPAGRTLGTETNDWPRQLGAVDFELGVIAGDRSWNPLYSALIPGVDDGKVSVRHARVSGMRDFKVLHASHTFMMMQDDVIREVKTFLETGRFTPVNKE